MKRKKTDLEIMLKNQEDFLKNHTPEEIHHLYDKTDPLKIKLFETPIEIEKPKE